MKAKTLAILALLGEVSAMDLNRQDEEHLVLLRKEIENDDGDQYMADSIKEAEAEVKAAEKAKAEGRFYQPLALTEETEAQKENEKLDEE